MRDASVVIIVMPAASRQVLAKQPTPTLETDFAIGMPIVTNADGSEQYQPWYAQRACPIFCYPCLPAYMGVWPARKCVLIIGVILFFIGVMILLSMLLVCLALECSNFAGALIPLAIILIIVGILLVHCGWAAHLLDSRGQVPIKKTVTTTTTTYHGDPESEEAKRILYEQAALPEAPELKQGYWKYEDKESWQAASNPYPIQHSLKACLDRQPY